MAHRSIELWASSFYLLEELSLVLSEEQFMHSRIKLKDDIERTKKDYSEKFAALLFDTLFKMALGEARHAKDKGFKVYVKGIEGGGRGDVYRLSERYNPQQCLPSLELLFGAGKWRESGYGGKPWYRIVKALGNYGNVPDNIFVDSCIGLSHNGGLAFNKHEADLRMTGLNCASYQSILNGKQKNNPTDLIKTKTIRSIFRSVYSLCVRVGKAGHFDEKLIKAINNLVTHEDAEYIPVKYKKRRKMQLLGGEYLKEARKFYNKDDFHDVIMNGHFSDGDDDVPEDESNDEHDNSGTYFGDYTLTEQMFINFDSNCDCAECKAVIWWIADEGVSSVKELKALLFPKANNTKKKTTKKKADNTIKSDSAKVTKTKKAKEKDNVKKKEKVTLVVSTR
ncbi:MAG: hypothetical protein KAS32_29465 [Candidatus Peribacteraceae bacterium]|nr:hypothetical protein [Candidatus Peribacteraceae bacterium]